MRGKTDGSLEMGRGGTLGGKKMLDVVVVEYVEHLSRYWNTKIEK